MSSNLPMLSGRPRNSTTQGKVTTPASNQWTALPMDIDQTTAELYEVKGENEKLKSELNKLDEERKELSRKIQQLTGNLESLKSENKELGDAKCELEICREKLKRGEEQVKKLDNELKEAKARKPVVPANVEAMRREAESQKKKIADLEDKLHREQSKNRDLNTAMTTYRSETHQAEEKRDRMKRKRDNVLSQWKEMEDKVAFFKQQNDELRAKDEANEERLNAAIAAKDEIIEQIKSEMHQMEVIKKEAEKKYSNLEVDNLKLRKELNKKRTISENEIARQAKLLEQMQSRMVEPVKVDPRLLGINLEERAAKREKKHQQISDFRDELARIKEEIQNLEDEKQAVQVELTLEVEKQQKAATQDTQSENPDSENRDILLDLQVKLGELDDNIDRRGVRIGFVRQQLQNLGIKPHTVDSEVMEEEEEETELTADEMVERIKKLREDRNRYRAESKAATEENAKLKVLVEDQTWKLEQIEKVMKGMLSKRIVTGTKPLSDFKNLL